MFILLMLSLQGSFAMETLEVNGTREEIPSFWSLTQNQSNSDVFNKMTNVTLSSGANRPRFFQIRGVGERSQFDNFNQSPVGFFYEHIDLSEEPHAISLRNKNMILQKESQSVGYGSKGMGGVIKSSSCLAEACQKNEVSLGVESYETVSGSYVQGIDWTDQFSSQINFYRRVSQGYQENSYLKSNTSDQDEYYTELHNVFSGSLNVESHHIFTYQDNGYDFFNTNNDYISDSDRAGREMSRIHGHSVVISKERGENLWKSISSLTQSRLQQSYDEDWGNNIFWNAVPGWNDDYDYYSDNQFEKTKFHQKLVFENEAGFLGVHYYLMDDQLGNVAFKNNQPRSQLDIKSRTQSLALYGGFIQKRNQWSLGESLRIENQERKLNGMSIEEYDNDLLWALEVTLNYKTSLSENIYSHISKSFRGGGYNLDTSLESTRRSYGPEDLYLLELGYNRLKQDSFLDFKVFYMLRDNMQLRTSFQDDLLDPSSFSYYTDNASSGQSYGGEIDYKIKMNSWTLQVGLAALISKFDEYKYANVDLSFRDVPYSPRYSFLLELGYDWTQKVSSSFSFYGQESFYFSNSHSEKSQPYQLLDMNLSYGLGSLEVMFWVKNIFDKHYSLRGFYFANEPPQWEPTLYTQPAAPRTIGLQLSYAF